MIFRRPLDAAAGAPAADSEARRARVALDHLRRTGRAPDEQTAGQMTPLGREWRALRRRRRVRTFRRTLAWLACVAVLAGAVAGSLAGGRSAFAWLRRHTDLLRVKSVSVAGVSRLEPAEILAATGLHVGQDLVALDPDSLRSALLELPRVKGALVERSWTREVRVVVEERKPRALVVLQETWEIDADGVLLPPDRSGRLADLPLIVGLPPDSALAGSRPDAPGLAAGLALAGRLAAAGFADAVSEIDITKPDSLVMILQPDGVPVRVGDGQIPERRLMALQGVLNDLARNETEAEYIDLRFAGMAAVMPLAARGESGAAAPAEAAAPPPATTRLAATPPPRAAAKGTKITPKSRSTGVKKPAVTSPQKKNARKSTVTGRSGTGAKKPAPKDSRRPHGKRA